MVILHNLRIRTLADLVATKSDDLGKFFTQSEINVLKARAAGLGKKGGQGKQTSPTTALQTHKKAITEIGLSARAVRGLNALKIRTLQDLKNTREKDLRACPLLGSTEILQIKRIAKSYGMELHVVRESD